MKRPAESEVSDVFPEIDFEEMNDCSIADVMSFLKSSFQADVFAKAESMMRLREGKLVTEKEEMERNLKELELEFREKRENLEKELELYRTRCVDLEERNRKAEADFKKGAREAEERYVLLHEKLREMESVKLAVEEELEKYRRTCGKLKELITRLEEDLKLMRERCEEMIAGLGETNKKEKEVQEEFIQLKVENRDLESGKQRAENEIEECKRRCRELEARVLQLEGENSVLRGSAQEKMTVESVKFLDAVCSEEKGKKESCKDVRSENGANDGKGSSNSMLLAHMKFEGKMLNSGEVIHASADVGGRACHSPVREKGVIHVAADPNFISVPSEPFIPVQVDTITDCLVTKEGNGSRVRKQMSPKDGSSDGKVASTVVRGTESVSGREVVLIGDSDDEMEVIPASNFNVEHIEKTRVPSKCLSGKALDYRRETPPQNSSKRKYSDQRSESAALEKDRSCEESFTPSSTTKRKHSSKVITSDDESDEDDNIPICKLKWKKLVDLCDISEKPSKSPLNQSCAALTFSFGSDRVEESITTSRRHLVPLQQCEETKCGTKRTSADYLVGQKLSPKTGNFILGTTETSYRMPEKTATENVKEDEVEDAESDSEDESFGGFIVRMCRSKESSKWQYEADMLSSFSKDPVLCMRAVCAIYRRQTSEEKSVQGSLYVNNRGFNKFDALRGSDLAEYLMDGDLHGPLKKSVEELEKHEPGAVEYCSQLATRYSRQLFEIYTNKEDSFFP